MRARRWNWVLGMFLTVVWGLVICRPGHAGEDPPQELLHYVREARQRGIKEAKIREQAEAIGWPAAAVRQALAREAGPSTPSTAGAIPGKIPGVGEASGGRGLTDEYLIGSGDTLQISVWQVQELSVPSVVVRPDGKITVPLIKDVDVGGLTPHQAEAMITAGLARFYAEPNVTVVIAAIASKKIYIVGAVRKEGTLPYSYGMTVMQALSEAGGLTEYARRKKIYVLRNEGGREYRLDFNYDEVVRGERTEQNMVLVPGDTVVVPH